MTSPATVSIIGLGLMGGSLALALRAAEEKVGPLRINGVSRSPATLQAARAAGAVDMATTDLAAAVAEADTIVLATPVRTILRLIPEVGRHARPGALVLDLGSTKAEICAALAGLPDGLQPVGGHPMCGKETGGFAAAEADLYRDKVFVLCRLPRTAQAAFDRALALVNAIGARPVIADPVAHDRAAAAISHLPYVAAVALVNAEAAVGDPLARQLAASGFRDTTRLAASDVEMMLDILLTNRAALLDWLDTLQRQLKNLQEALSAGDEAALRAQLAAARARREGWRM
ncbi:MAG: prephenate dehydrogenase [Anaerolineae bacterium]|nr:prephenate dehydrogenase [Anaerolineae bacterium]